MTEVVVVDDDADLRSLLRAFLEEAGYAVTMAPDGQAALTYLQGTTRPVMVVLDQQMPRMIGTELLATALRTDGHARRRAFILMTSGPRPVLPDMPDGHDGRVPVLAKPFTVDTLLDTVAQAADRLAGPLKGDAGHDDH